MTSETDPWDEGPPNAEDLSADDLLHFLRICDFAPLSEWELNFCHSMIEWVESGFTITEGQFGILNRLMKILWDNDPDLWDYPDDESGSEIEF